MSEDPTAHTFRSCGLTLNCLDWGNAEAPLLVLVHGSKGHARSWDQLAAAFRADWHVVAPDLRGHGDSQWSPDAAYLSSYHIRDLAALFAGFGDEKAVLLGHSFGGNLAARFAATFPERVAKLVLVDGFGPLPEAYDRWAEVGPATRTREWLAQTDAIAARPQKLFATIAEAAARLRAGNARLSAELAVALAEHGLRRLDEGYVWKCDPLASLFPPEDFSADNATVWRDIQCPTLLCHGAESWNRNPETDGRAALLRDYRIAAIPEAGHWPHHDNFPAFLPVLRDFLNTRITPVRG